MPVPLGDAQQQPPQRQRENQTDLQNLRGERRLNAVSVRKQGRHLEQSEEQRQENQDQALADEGDISEGDADYFQNQDEVSKLTILLNYR